MDWDNFLEEIDVKSSGQTQLDRLSGRFPGIHNDYDALPPRPTSRVVLPHQLQGDLRQLYDRLRSQHDLKVMYGRIDQVQSKREIDFLMTTFYKHHSCEYWISKDDDGKTHYHAMLPKAHHAQVTKVNLADAYQTRNRLFNKQRFDCFGRGTLVLHPLPQGGTLSISVCQAHFFEFIFNYHVLDFLQDVRESLQNARRCRSKRKRVSDKEVKLSVN